MIQRHFIGLSSGASMLGVDAALVLAQGIGNDLRLRLECFHHLPYSRDLRGLLLHVAQTPTLRHLATLHRVLGETCAIAVRQLLEHARRPGLDVMCIACPGQTIWHDADGRFPSNLSLGMSAVVAERTGITTLSDFASRDLAAGGQGVPTTARVDALLLGHPQEHRVLIHLGSVATIVALPPHPRRASAFQATPGTMILDGLMRLLTNGREPFDASGKNAVQGRCLEPLVERCLQAPFFQRRPPRCVPRDEFGIDFLNVAIEHAKELNGNLHDVLCSMTHFVARAICASVSNHLPTAPTRVILSGKGVRNGLLWHLLEQRLHPIPLEKSDAHGIPAEACRATAHAGLAALALDGLPLNLPSATGAAGARLLGHFTPGDAANWSRCITWMARMQTPIRAAA